MTSKNFHLSISKVLLKTSQNSLENTCAEVSFIIMLRAAVSVPCQKYIEDKFFTHMFRQFFHQIHFFSAFFCSVLIFPLKSLYCIRSFLIFPLKTLYCICLVVLTSEVYSEPCGTSKMEFPTKTVNGLKPQNTAS